MPGSKGKDRLHVVIPLLHSQSLKACGGITGKGLIAPDPIITWLLSESGYSLLSFGPPAGNGHMIGMRCEGSILQMFDANQALFQYSEVSSFKQHMQELFSQEYLNHTGGKWGVFRVISDV